MPHSPDRFPARLIAITSGILLMTGAAQAQIPAGDGTMRYLSWANRPTSTAPGEVLARSRNQGGLIPRRVAPSLPIQRSALSSASLPVATTNGLTPASAWLGPRSPPAYPSASPDAVPRTTTELHASTGQPVADATPVEDPMAPRRDAPIFRLQPQGSAVTGQAPPNGTAQDPTRIAASPAPSGQQGARYYSVHRDAGRQPDPTVIPEPVFFDSVTLDLAEPPATEPLMRDARGRRAAVANADPSLP